MNVKSELIFSYTMSWRVRRQSNTTTKVLSYTTSPGLHLSPCILLEKQKAEDLLLTFL